MGTSLGNLSFLDEETLYLKLPATRGGITFRAFARGGHTDRRGGTFKGDPEHRRTHRNIGYTTNARILHNTIVEGADDLAQVDLQYDASDTSRADGEIAFVLNITPRLGLKRAVPPPARRWNAARCGSRRRGCYALPFSAG